MITPAKSSSHSSHIDVAIAIVFDAAHERVLICLRKLDTVLAGYWEFPGGKCDPGEPPVACAVREIREEVGIVILPTHMLTPIEHEYPYARVRLHPFVCEHVGGTVQHLAVADAKWLPPDHVLNYRFPEANLRLMQLVGAGFAALIAEAAPLV